jgi:hypothetical protein
MLMFKNLLNRIKLLPVGAYFLGCFIGLFVFAFGMQWYSDQPLKEYEGGIQNRLVWNIKGECYFVRPATNTVHLVRVIDCDRVSK